jgi:chromosome segregation ATPase
MTAKVAAQQMIGDIEKMNISELSAFLRDNDNVEAFFERLQAHKDELAKWVQDAADINQIDRLLREASDMQAMAKGELEQAREEVKELRADADANLQASKDVLAEAMGDAEELRRDAHAAAEKLNNKAQVHLKNTQAKEKLAEENLDRARADRAKARETKEYFASKRKQIEALLKALSE